MPPRGDSSQTRSAPTPFPARELARLGPGVDPRVRRTALLVASGIATVLSGTFWALAASKGAAPSERVILPMLTALFCGVGVMTWLGRLRHAELLLLAVGGGILLERIHYTTRLDAPGLRPIVDAYELFIWFPCVYAFAFLLLERRQAVLFNLALIGVSLVIVRDWLWPGGRGPDHADLPEFYIGLLSCVFILNAFSYMRERLIDTHRIAVDMRTFAETDFLTDIPNRRALSGHLEREIKRSAREGTSLSVILMDLDRFKQINDRHGHEEGDRALRRVAGVVDEARRETDYFGRWGGEEFLIVAPDLDIDHGLAAADRLRGLIEDSAEAGDIEVTASFGVSEYRFGDGVASLVKRADEALMRAKESGRNKVCSGP